MGTHKIARPGLLLPTDKTEEASAHESTPHFPAEKRIGGSARPPRVAGRSHSCGAPSKLALGRDVLRIWEVTPYSLASVSGVTTLVRDLSRRFEQHGCRVTVLTPDAPESGWSDNHGVISLGAPGPFRNARLAWRTAASLWKNRQCWDLLHLHQGHPMTCVAAFVSRVLARPTVVTFHVQTPRGLPLRSFPTRIASYLVERFATRRVFVSERTMLDFQLEGRVIRNGVDVSHVQAKLRSRVDLRSELALAGFVVAFSGRRARNKGYVDLLRAISKVRAFGIDARLLALGPVDSADADEISALVDENGLQPSIVDLGERTDCLEFLSAADAIALPSYREGFPMSLLEGMAAGLPAIATDVGGIPELVTNGHDGFLIRPGDIEALSQAIRRLAENPTLKQSLALEAQMTAQTHNSEATAVSYLEVFEEARSVGGGGCQENASLGRSRARN